MAQALELSETETLRPHAEEDPLPPSASKGADHARPLQPPRDYQPGSTAGGADRGGVGSSYQQGATAGFQAVSSI